MNSILDMEIFARIVRTGTMTAASRELGISPAVVSKRIRKLEERLGSRLFQRTTRQISLTESGSAYYQRVIEILASIEEAENAISQDSNIAKGTLRVAAPTSFGRMHIAPHLGPFLDAHPELTIHLTLSDRLIDIVGDSVDVAIRIAELEDSSLVAHRLGPNNRVICASPRYLETHDTPQTLADLQEHNCLATDAQDVWRLEGPDGPVDVRVTGRLQTNSSEVVREAVLAGIGIALRSTWDIGPELTSGRLKILLPQYRVTSRVGLYAVFPSKRFLPVKVRLFIDFLDGIYGPNPYWDAGLEL